MYLSHVAKQKNHLRYLHCLIYLTDDATLPQPHNSMNSELLIVASQTTESIRLQSQNDVHSHTFFYQVFDLLMPQHLVLPL